MSACKHPYLAIATSFPDSSHKVTPNRQKAADAGNNARPIENGQSWPIELCSKQPYCGDVPPFGVYCGKFTTAEGVCYWDDDVVCCFMFTSDSRRDRFLCRKSLKILWVLNLQQTTTTALSWQYLVLEYYFARKQLIAHASLYFAFDVREFDCCFVWFIEITEFSW